MLGRHVYRVMKSETGDWSVHKDGEEEERGRRPTRADATAYAAALASGDEPSKIVVADESGALVEERMFGLDDAALAGGEALPGLEGKPGKG